VRAYACACVPEEEEEAGERADGDEVDVEPLVRVVRVERDGVVGHQRDRGEEKREDEPGLAGRRGEEDREEDQVERHVDAEEVDVEELVGSRQEAVVVRQQEMEAQQAGRRQQHVRKVGLLMELEHVPVVQMTRTHAPCIDI
jgi:hypothetical protein